MFRMSICKQIFHEENPQTGHQGVLLNEDQYARITLQYRYRSIHQSVDLLYRDQSEDTVDSLNMDQSEGKYMFLEDQFAARQNQPSCRPTTNTPILSQMRCVTLRPISRQTNYTRTN